MLSEPINSLLRSQQLALKSHLSSHLITHLPHLCEHLIAFFLFQHPVFQHHFIRIPGSLRIVTRLPSLLTLIGPCFEAVFIIHSVQIHQHHPASPAYHIFSHWSNVVSSLAIYSIIIYSHPYSLSPLPSPLLYIPSPFPTVIKTLVNPIYFVSLAVADRTTCKRK